jgi:hypothetical protein
LAPEPLAYRYREDVLTALLAHGVRPQAHTRPHLVREFVNDLYRHELRNLREQLLQHAFPKHEYYGRVVQVRKRYWVLSMRAHEWIE